MNVASMSPRVHAAAISGGRMLRTCASVGLSPASSIAYSRWKWLVDTNGVRDLLALEVGDAVDAAAVAGDQRLGGADVVEDPEQLDVEALADAPWRSAPMPASPSCTSPEAIARITSPPPPNCRQLIL